MVSKTCVVKKSPFSSDVRSLHDLYDTVIHMDREVFSQYVNGRRHDIYQWVKVVHGDARLASDLLDCHTREAVLLCLSQKLKRKPISEASKKRKVLKSKVSQEFIEKITIQKTANDIVKSVKEVLDIGS